ncbi:MAG: ABC transporter substrate-binding protein, partial [Gammaproteobacteria bacterium]
MFSSNILGRLLIPASLTAALLLSVTGRAAPPNDYLPPWNLPPQDGKYFTIPEIDIIADLHGDVTDPQLVVFFSGNQFMVVH